MIIRIFPYILGFLLVRPHSTPVSALGYWTRGTYFLVFFITIKLITYGITTILENNNSPKQLWLLRVLTVLSGIILLLTITAIRQEYKPIAYLFYFMLSLLMVHSSIVLLLRHEKLVFWSLTNWIYNSGIGICGIAALWANIEWTGVLFGSVVGALVTSVEVATMIPYISSGNKRYKVAIVSAMLLCMVPALIGLISICGMLPKKFAAIYLAFIGIYPALKLQNFYNEKPLQYKNYLINGAGITLALIFIIGLW
jgi:hypothetical protein